MGKLKRRYHGYSKFWEKFNNLPPGIIDEFADDCDLLAKHEELLLDKINKAIKRRKKLRSR